MIARCTWERGLKEPSAFWPHEARDLGRQSRLCSVMAESEARYCHHDQQDWRQRCGCIKSHCSPVAKRIVVDKAYHHAFSHQAPCICECVSHLRTAAVSHNDVHQDDVHQAAMRGSPLFQLLACAWSGSFLGELADGAPSLFDGSALRISHPMLISVKACSIAFIGHGRHVPGLCVS